MKPQGAERDLPVPSEDARQTATEQSRLAHLPYFLSLTPHYHSRVGQVLTSKVNV